MECLLNNNYNIIKLNGKQTIGTHSIKTGPFIFACSQSKILESTADVQDGCTSSDKYQPPELKNAAMPWSKKEKRLSVDEWKKWEGYRYKQL